jgi:hypothetical protein
MGRRVETLVDGTLEAGQHQVRFSAGQLPSGVYLYRLTTPIAVLVRSMILGK